MSGSDGATEATTFVAHLDYNARGQRTLISYGNGTRSEYAYDPLTFRLISLATVRGGQRLQDLRYAYDPVGNPDAGAATTPSSGSSSATRSWSHPPATSTTRSTG